MKEAFEVFCNKIVAGCSSAELLASYCDNILKKGGSEKLSDEAIEETLDKVIMQTNLTARISFSNYIEIKVFFFTLSLLVVIMHFAGCQAFGIYQ